MNSQSNNSIRTPVLGCIADDVTGATDLATNLVQGGMCVIQVLGVPTLQELSQLNADAIVVALKSRSTPREQAVEQSLDSLSALQQLGIDRFFFKYCSTFDSTEEGNIGPVAESLMSELGIEQTIFCPAFPQNGRTVYQGHLFVHGAPLNESGMENHPLNPMTDANLVRFLGKQACGKVGCLSYEALSNGLAGLGHELKALADSGTPLVIADACDDRHLEMLAQAVTEMRLVTGGSGIARYLPSAYRASGFWDASDYQPQLPFIEGRSLILSGSCSNATNQQVAWMKKNCATWEIDVPALISDSSASLQKIVAWAQAANPSQSLLVYSTTTPDQVQSLQRQFGVETVARSVEQLMAAVATTLVSDLGIRRLILAGGETAGAVVNELGIKSLRIGPDICAGVPWTESIADRPLALALKSGNFGAEDFFQTALEMLP